MARGIEVMTTLNARAAVQARAAGAHALTDVTGFGLLGHTHELAAASGLAAEIDAEAVPAIEGVLELLSDERALAGGSKRNRRDADEFTSWGAVDPARARLVCDAMTSGGLLAALPRAPRSTAGGSAAWSPALPAACAFSKEGQSLFRFGGVFGGLTDRYWIYITSI